MHAVIYRSGLCAAYGNVRCGCGPCELEVARTKGRRRSGVDSPGAAAAAAWPPGPGAADDAEDGCRPDAEDAVAAATRARRALRSLRSRSLGVSPLRPSPSTQLVYCSISRKVTLVAASARSAAMSHM